jgi:hypothetical protein
MYPHVETDIFEMYSIKNEDNGSGSDAGKC